MKIAILNVPFLQIGGLGLKADSSYSYDISSIDVQGGEPPYPSDLKSNLNFACAICSFVEHRDTESSFDE